LKDLKKKYSVAAVIGGAIIIGILVFSYNNTNQTNPIVTNQQPNSTNPIVTVTPPTTTGRHFSVGVNETMTVKTTR